MKALLLGLELQGKAVAHDLERSSIIDEMITADLEVQKANDYLARQGYKKVKVVSLNASREGELNRIVRGSGAQIVISMLPLTLGYPAARAALDA